MIESIITKMIAENSFIVIQPLIWGIVVKGKAIQSVDMT